MDMIAGLANMRARNYSIPEVDKLKAKFIAGRIIPAIVTSTAMATGLVWLKLYKVLDGGHKSHNKNLLDLPASLLVYIFELLSDAWWLCRVSAVCKEFCSYVFSVRKITVSLYCWRPVVDSELVWPAAPVASTFVSVPGPGITDLVIASYRSIRRGNETISTYPEVEEEDIFRNTPSEEGIVLQKIVRDCILREAVLEEVRFYKQLQLVVIGDPFCQIFCQVSGNLLGCYRTNDALCHYNCKEWFFRDIMKFSNVKLPCGRDLDDVTVYIITIGRRRKLYGRFEQKSFQMILSTMVNRPESIQFRAILDTVVRSPSGESGPVPCAGVYSLGNLSPDDI